MTSYKVPAYSALAMHDLEQGSRQPLETRLESWTFHVPLVFEQTNFLKDLRSPVQGLEGPNLSESDISTFLMDCKAYHMLRQKLDNSADIKQLLIHTSRLLFTIFTIVTGVLVSKGVSIGAIPTLMLSLLALVCIFWATTARNRVIKRFDLMDSVSLHMFGAMLRTARSDVEVATKLDNEPDMSVCRELMTSVALRSKHEITVPLSLVSTYHNNVGPPLVSLFTWLPSK